MAAYYNENDPKTAAWLRELIRQGLIADGEVDTRSIVDVQPADLRGFVQCHFFAGIGGWSYALRLAGWSDGRECWTGSCPCQPFSSAGAQAGGTDARDLWPAWFQLIAECRPGVVFGEQVESAIGHGWLDRLHDDLEAEDYAVGPVGLPSASVGAFDIRQRLWFVADALRAAGERRTGSVSRAQAALGSAREFNGNIADRLADGREACGVADANGQRHERERVLLQQRKPREDRAETAWSGTAGLMGESNGAREAALRSVSGRSAIERRRSPWAEADWIACRDGKSRPVESGTFPLASGIPARVGRLRGYGNAINPYVAAEVIGAYMEIVDADAAMTTTHSEGHQLPRVVRGDPVGDRRQVDEAREKASFLAALDALAVHQEKK